MNFKTLQHINNLLREETEQLDDEFDKAKQDMDNYPDYSTEWRESEKRLLHANRFLREANEAYDDFACHDWH